MHCFVVHLAAAAFLLHGLLGCCWHHDHEVVVRRCPAADAPQASAPAVCCHHAGSAGPLDVLPLDVGPTEVPSSEKGGDVPRRSPCPSGACCVAAARALLTAPLQFDESGGWEVTGGPPVAAHGADGHPDAGAESRVVRPGPLRLHLLYGILRV